MVRSNRGAFRWGQLLIASGMLVLIAHSWVPVRSAPVEQPRLQAQPIFVSGRQVEYQARTMGTETYVPLSLLAGPLGLTIATDPIDQSLRISQPDDAGRPLTVLIVGEDDSAVKLLADAGIAVTRRGEFPATLDGYSAVWITTASGLRPSCRKVLAEFISAGGGLVTSGDIPAGIAGTQFKYRNSDLDIADLQPICDWFGAKAIWRGERLARGRSKEDVDLKLPKKLFERPIELEVGTYPLASSMALEVDSRTARSLLSTAAGESFIYTHTFGEGRIYWQFTRHPQRNYPDPPRLIIPAVRWVARMK